MKKTFKVVCCHCGHINLNHNIDKPLEQCEVCKEILSTNSCWNPHSVRIFIEDADPNLIDNFIDEIKCKRVRLEKKKTTIRKNKLFPKTARKVA